MTKNIWVLFSLVTILLSQSTEAQLYEGQNFGRLDKTLTMDQITNKVHAGDILIIGEVHGVPQIQAKQLELLQALKNKGLQLSIGFEFLNHTDQISINDYRKNLISEDDFKKVIRWGSGFDFKNYKDQILFPDGSKQELSVGLNIPNTISKQIAATGYDSLSLDQKILLPLDFTTGNINYKKRFILAAGPHLPSDKIDNYFQAQSAWDESMAYQTVQHVYQNKSQIFVIIVGEFHVQYGGGLPDRLKQRLIQKGLNNNILTLSQIWSEGMTSADIESEIKPSPDYGQRSDFIWVINP